MLNVKIENNMPAILIVCNLECDKEQIVKSFSHTLQLFY